LAGNSQHKRYCHLFNPGIVADCLVYFCESGNEKTRSGRGMDTEIVYDEPRAYNISTLLLKSDAFQLIARAVSHDKP